MIPLQHISVTDSTNALLRRQGSKENIAVRADEQTAGRGQRGNRWHSLPGLNLLMSLLWHPVNLPAREQFSLSEAVALSICDVLMEYGVKTLVKWPNDIYVGDRKICGILIENAIGREVESSIIGIGLNLNQKEFPEELPNPESLSRLTGKSIDCQTFAGNLIEHLEKNLLKITSSNERARIHRRFLQSLWRGDGKKYPFMDKASGTVFKANIADVEPEGFLILDSGDKKFRYAFKEVEFLL